jgi:hypothetical protein
MISKSLRAIAFASFLLTTPAFAQSPQDKPTTTLAQLQPNDYYEISWTAKTPDGKPTKRTLFGKLIHKDETHLKLTNAWAMGRTERATSVLAAVPYIGRQFRTVGIGYEIYGDREFTIPRKDILTARQLQPSEIRK